MPINDNAPAPTGLDLVIERLTALTAELQQQAAAAAEPAAPLPVVLTAPEPEQVELEASGAGIVPDGYENGQIPDCAQTELANALIQHVADAVAPLVAKLVAREVHNWLRRHQLELPGWDSPGWQVAVRGDLTGTLAELLWYNTFTRAPRPE